ncbi:MAG: futalosine hydrolase [Bacteroidales bacterium]|jgi:futalosine hydrolase|nr:futalosine hydrolase [Bacteroidales bacterium]
MSLKILIVTATEAEASALKRIPELRTSVDGFLLSDCEISVLITGVGCVATSWAMAKWISANPSPDLAVNIGIAGSYRDEIKIGEVVVPVEDCFADSGIEESGRFLTLAEAGLADPDKFPFKKGKIEADNQFIRTAINRMKPVNAITVNTASGTLQTIERLVKKYNPDIETMEGAAFFYICSGEKIPFLALRSISNKVEPRNKDNWNIRLALDNLSEKLKEYILSLD